MRTPAPRIHNMRPDPPDFRDRVYNSTLPYPARTFNAQPAAAPLWADRVKDQKKTEACTGFALSSMVEALSYRAWKDNEEQWPAPNPISPFMLYYMACRYDDIPGTDPASGSTARAAMKAWHKNGACRLNLWPKLTKDAALIKPAQANIET